METNRIKNKISKILSMLVVIILINSCAPLKSPTVINNEPITNYKYIFITPTNNLTSNTGSVYGGNHGVYGTSTGKSINPSDVISGILIKEGFIRIPEIKPELSDKTLIVNYGESGKRNRGLGYTIEVTIQFISAKTNSEICSCTAEGQGSTEVDDIRQAITRCLNSLLIKEN